LVDLFDYSKLFVQNEILTLLHSLASLCEFFLNARTYTYIYITLRLNPHIWKHGFCSNCSTLRPLSNFHLSAGEWQNINTTILRYAQKQTSSDVNSGELF